MQLADRGPSEAESDKGGEAGEDEQGDFGVGLVDDVEADAAESTRAAFEAVLANPCHVIVAPMEDGLPGALLLGSKSACHADVVEERAIGAIVQTAEELDRLYPKMANNLVALQHTKGLAVLQLKWRDDLDFDIGMNIDQGLAFIQRHRREGRNTLISCAQGKSRSAALCVAYLMCTRRCSFDGALEFIQSKRSIANPNPEFERFLSHEFQAHDL